MLAARQLGRPGPDQQIASGIDLGIHFGIFADFWVGLGSPWCAVACGDGAGVPFAGVVGRFCWLGEVLIAAWLNGLLARWAGLGCGGGGLARGLGFRFETRCGAVCALACWGGGWAGVRWWRGWRLGLGFGLKTFASKPLMGGIVLHMHRID